MFYVGLTAAFTVTAIIILTVCRLNRKKPSSFRNPLCPRQFSRRQMGKILDQHVATMLKIGWSVLLYAKKFDV